MYPTLAREAALRFVTQRWNARNEVEPPKAELAHSGSEVDESLVAHETLEEVLTEWKAAKDGSGRSDNARDGLEGRLSPVLYQGLSAMSTRALTDRGFWRYCAVQLYDFVVWRQASSSLDAMLPYFGLKNRSLGRDCVPLRMFDRAYIVHEATKLSGTGEDYSLAQIAASDVWKSHIHRVLIGNAPLVVREMLIGVQAGKLKTDLVRDVAKSLRRTRSNVLFEVLDPIQAGELLERETNRSSKGSGGGR